MCLEFHMPSCDLSVCQMHMDDDADDDNDELMMIHSISITITLFNHMG